MIDNNNIETFSKNNPFLFDEITSENIGTGFDSESASTGDIVCITSLYEELIRRFGSYENAKFIYEFARSAIVDCKYAQNYPLTAVPYLDFTVYLEQTIIDEGILSPYATKWVAGKKYYIGDTVYYSIDGSDSSVKTYVLVNGDNTETKEIPFSVYEANSGDSRYSTSEGKYYITSSFYRGYYDKKTRLTYFDTLKSDGSIKLEHWKESISTNSNSTMLYESITGTTESLLQNVMRKKSDMDFSGNTLPFILHYDDVYDPSTGIKTGRELNTDETETFYMCGNVNMDYDFESGKVVADVLESVTFYNSDNENVPMVIFTEVNKPIVITLDKMAYTSDNDKRSIADCNMVQFVYYSTATLTKEEGTNNWIRKENTGVKYIENRPMLIQRSNFDLELDNGDDIFSMIYITVNENTQDEKDADNIDIIKSLRSNINYSKITVDRSQLGDDYLLSAVTFKDEATMGVQNVTMDVNVSIERGIAESFQKHNMLGEICTLQDLENYKNGRYLE